MILRILACFILLCSTALAADVTYYFNSYDSNFNFLNPDNIVDGSTSTYATCNVDTAILFQDSNTYGGGLSYSINEVHMRVYYSITDTDGTADLELLPWFGPAGEDTENKAGEIVTVIDGGVNVSSRWSEWYEISNDSNAPKPFSFSDIETLEMAVGGASHGSVLPELRVYKVEIRVTYGESIRGMTIN